jgi:glycosyltransferase involved in cell wall biosynthesis
MTKKLSIITINKNNADGLMKTIESVLCQTFKDFEYIIIDGASTDNSVSIINEYSQYITYFVSEPDGGIYDAINKGIKAANGEYCLFLNSGDYLISSLVLEKLFQHDLFEDIIYGDIIFENNSGQRTLIRYDSALSILNFIGSANWCFICHQCCFIKLNLFLQFGLYRTDLSILSDQAFLIKTIFEHGATYRYVPIAISIFNLLSMTDGNLKKVRLEHDKIALELLKLPILYNSIKSIAFYDKVWNTPFVGFWYNLYNAICKIKLRVKRFLGRDFWYNQYKFLKLNNKNKMFISKKIQVQKSKKLLIWGTGADGKRVYDYCFEHKIFIYGFLDSSEAKQQYAFFGRPVFAPKFAFENKDKGFFIVVASRDYCEEISKTCREAGLVEGKDFVVPFDGC